MTLSHIGFTDVRPRESNGHALCLREIKKMDRLSRAFNLFLFIPYTILAWGIIDTAKNYEIN